MTDAAWFWVVYAVLSIVFMWWFSRWVDGIRWRARVRSLMEATPQHRAESVRVLKTMLALDGKLMPRDIKDAITVWLAENEAP